MGTNNGGYAEELQERAESLQSSDSEAKQEQGAELDYLAQRMEGDNETEVRATQIGAQSAGVLASDVEELELEWVWKNWIPKQFVGMFVGDSGIGKSSVIRDLIKRLSRGETLPDGQQSGKCGVVVISYEEPTETVLKPRLRECGADLTRIKILSTVKLKGKMGEPSERAFRVPDDLGMLRKAIIEVDAGIVFIDPLMSMTDKAIARNQTAREVLDALQSVAQERGVAIVIVAHVNKGRSAEMRQRMNSSKAFYDMPRFVIAAAQDVSNPDRATLWMDKHSLCGDVATLTYERKGGTIKYISGHVEEAKADFAQQEAETTSTAILAVLSDSPAQEYQARTIANRIHVNYDAVRKQLQRMANAGTVERTVLGYYRLPVPKKEEDAENKVMSHVPCPTEDKPTTEEAKIVASNLPTEVLAPTNGHSTPVDPNTLTEVLI